MQKPFYIHTPRNIYGESLVYPDNGVSYEIRAVHTDKEIHAKESNRKKAEKIKDKLNIEHASFLAHADGI